MKKEISQKTLADLCCCDTSSIYLVTSGRQDPYCAENSIGDSCSSGLQRALGSKLELLRCYAWCPAMSVTSDGFQHPRAVLLTA